MCIRDSNYPDNLDKGAIKKAIVNENKWELAGEGVRRWYLCHWGYDCLLYTSSLY